MRLSSPLCSQESRAQRLTVLRSTNRPVTEILSRPSSEDRTQPITAWTVCSSLLRMGGRSGDRPRVARVAGDQSYNAAGWVQRRGVRRLAFYPLVPWDGRSGTFPARPPSALYGPRSKKSLPDAYDIVGRDP